jgi:predicted secreted protein
MFSDARSKSVILVAHCILNQNSKMDGTASYSGPIIEILDLLLQSNVGILQMPCPEMICLGLDRGNKEGYLSPVVEENSRIRFQMDQDSAKDKMKSLIADLVFQVLEYQRNGFRVLGIVGVNRSPSCGVETTSKDNQEAAGEGVFIESCRRELEETGININFVGIKAFEPEAAVDVIRNLICLLYTSPSTRYRQKSRMPSYA